MHQSTTSKCFKVYQNAVSGNRLTSRKEIKMFEQKFANMQEHMPKFSSQLIEDPKQALNQLVNNDTFVNQTEINGINGNCQSNSASPCLYKCYRVSNDKKPSCNITLLHMPSYHISKISENEEVAEKQWQEFKKVMHAFCKHPHLANAKILKQLNMWHCYYQEKIDRKFDKFLEQNIPDVIYVKQRTINWVQDSNPGNYSEDFVEEGVPMEEEKEMDYLKETRAATVCDNIVKQNKLPPKKVLPKQVVQNKKAKDTLKSNTKKTSKSSTPKGGKVYVKSTILTRSATKKLELAAKKDAALKTLKNEF